MSKYGCRVATIVLVVLFAVGVLSVGGAFGQVRQETPASETARMTGEVVTLMAASNELWRLIGITRVAYDAAVDAVKNGKPDVWEKAQALAFDFALMDDQTRIARDTVSKIGVTRAHLEDAIFRDVNQAVLASWFQPLNTAFFNLRGFAKACDFLVKRSWKQARQAVRAAGNPKQATERLIMTGVYFADARLVCGWSYASALRLEKALKELVGVIRILTPSDTTAALSVPKATPVVPSLDQFVALSLSGQQVASDKAAAGVYFERGKDGRLRKVVVLP